MMFCHWIIFESVIICIWSIDPNQLEVTDTTGTETYVLLIYFDFCALFVFALCLVPSVPCVSGLSIIAVLCLSSLCVLVPVLLCVSGLSIIDVLCLSSLCVLFPVFLVSLDCLWFLCFVCLRFVSCSQCSLCLWIVYSCCALFVFALCLVPSVPCVSGLSILDYSFCFFLTFIVYLFPMQLLTRVIFLRMILFTKKLCNSYIIPGTNYNNLMKSCDTID
jgi:hypothetical protein